MVIWLIGMAGAGKTVIGRELYALLKERKPNVVFLDGDSVRSIMGGDLGYTLDDRRKNAWRICRLSQFLESQGMDVIVAILALFPETLEWNRENYSKYFEVFIEVPMPVLVARDQKKLYSRALAGEINNVAGIDIPFNPPAHPDLIVHNSDAEITAAQHAGTILSALDAKFRDHDNAVSLHPEEILG